MVHKPMGIKKNMVMWYMWSQANGHEEEYGHVVTSQCATGRALFMHAWRCVTLTFQRGSAVC